MVGLTFHVTVPLQVAAVERVVDTISVCSVHDRASVKHLEQLMQICATPAMHDISASPR